jgi:beta-glucosidase/6-phospho-beta-glucosidase/beta-galactosidase
VRESAGWRVCARADEFDFASVEQRAACASELGIQILWTCCHYGMPTEHSDLGPGFIDAFARYCEAFARALAPFKAYSDHRSIYTPINEISFLAWAMCETRLMHGFRGGRSAEEAHRLKMRLVAAALAGCDAIRNVDPDALRMHVVAASE